MATPFPSSVDTPRSRTAPRRSTLPSSTQNSFVKKEFPTTSKSSPTQNQRTMAPNKHSHKPNTTIIAEIDVGWGNSLTIRGEGGPLSWDKGIQMKYQKPNSWTWETSTTIPLTFKFLINDQQWAQGENQTVVAGSTYIGTPHF